MAARLGLVTEERVNVERMKGLLFFTAPFFFVLLAIETALLR